tara:strand:+ start:345 stop:491 length:147 start_codon:yes stop_codon:yes gene_type:complete
MATYPEEFKALEERIAELEAENEQYRKTLKKLARLGSDIIAQQALKGK